MSIIIDGPDLIRAPSGGTRNQWDAKFRLEFVNPLTIPPDPANPGTVTLATIAGLEQARLWTVNQQTGKNDVLLGTYTMPFQVKVTKIQRQPVPASKGPAYTAAVRRQMPSSPATPGSGLFC